MTTMKIAWIVCVFLVLSAQAILIKVPSTERRCVFDILKKDMLATGHFSVELNQDDRPTGVQINTVGPDGEVVFSSENAEEGKFAFAAREAGRYTTCVLNTNLMPKQIELKLKSGVEAKDLSEVAQKEHLMPLGLELLRLEQVTAEIRNDLKYLFQTEADMRNVNEETNSRVRFMTAISLAVIFSMGVWQVVYVRRFLAAKKVA